MRLSRDRGSIVVLTGAGISKESGLSTFRDADGIWATVRIEDVATPEAFRRDPQKVHAFYNQRRRSMLGELETLARMARDGRKVRLPLLNREMPLVADVWAKPELGTGCVKITPAHDPNDYEVGLRQGLAMIAPGAATLVIHSGTIRALLAIALDLAPDAALRFAIDPLSVTRLDQTTKGWRIVYVNRTAPD